MASHTAIADAGNTLVDLLCDRTGDSLGDDEVVLGSPGEEGPGEDVRLTVYLYDVRENEHLSNDRTRPDAAGATGGAALVLDLHYLLTAHPKTSQSNAKRTRKSMDQHEVLGRAMQVVAENGVVRDPDLDGSLAGEELTLSFASVDRRELLDVWATFTEVPYRPSVACVVSPVVIDGDADGAAPRVLAAEFPAYAVEEGDDR